MTAGVTIDLRGYDFETIKELNALCKDTAKRIAREMPDVVICGFVVSDHQHKMLNVERYMQGIPERVIRRTRLDNVGGIPIIIAEREEPIQCITDHLHDNDQAW